MTSHRRWLICALLLLSCLPVRAQAGLQVSEAKAQLSFTPTTLVFDLPLGSETPATIETELLDPQNGVQAKGTGTCVAHICHAVLPATQPIGIGNGNEQTLALFRIRYTVTATSQPAVTGVLAVARIAPSLFQLQATAPQAIRPGGLASIRIRATHPLTGAPQAGVPLQMAATATLEDKDEDRTLVTKRVVTDRRGFATLEFTAPREPGLTSVTVTSVGQLATARIALEQEIAVRDLKSLSLTTDKPLYQPGQTVHLRALVLDRAGVALPNTELTFDVQDPDSTLVYRTHATTSKYGIASVDWPVAARARLGSYSIAAEGENVPRGQATVRVSRYDLPTFTVAPKPDKPFYLPGQPANVSVRANYLFGKPVQHGHVRVVREMERTWNDATQRYDTPEGQTVAGELGPDGSFAAHLDLAADGRQLQRKAIERYPQEFTDLHLVAYVTDASTSRTEQQRFDLRVTLRPVQVYVVRDASYVAGLSNGFTVVASSADGAPLPGAKVRVALLPRASSDEKETLDDRAAHALFLAEFKTNPYGLARIDGLPQHAWLVEHTPPPLTGTPAEDEDEAESALLVSVLGPKGEAGRTSESFAKPSAILRVTAEHTLYKPGDPIRVTVESARKDLPVMVQVLRDTRSGYTTLATSNLILADGHGTVTFATGSQDKPDPRFTGALTVVASAIGTWEKRDKYGQRSDPTASWTILFPRDNALQVKVKLARESYRPGETATATIDVSGPQDPDGDEREPERVALGAAGVDQAVLERNRSDNEFGGGDGFFFPRRYLSGGYGSVAGVTSLDLEQLPPEKPFPPGLDLVAAALLHRGGGVNAARYADGSPSAAYDNVYSKILTEELGPMRTALTDHLKSSPDAPTEIPALDQLLAPNKLSFSELRDPWGMPFGIATEVNYNNLQLQAVSAGPDKLRGTPDDFTVWLSGWSWFERHRRDLQRVVRDEYGRTHRFIRDLPDLEAAMARAGIDFHAWRDPWDQPLTWSFPIETTDYTVTAHSQGPTQKPGRKMQFPFDPGSASMPWFTDGRNRVQESLNAYTAQHAFPMTDAALTDALAAKQLTLASLIDPWQHPLYPEYRSRTIYTDRVTVEARGKMGEVPQKKIHITPVTATVETLDLRSAGPDGIRGNADDFTVTSLSHLRDQQAAAAPKPTAATASATGNESSGLRGVVTDASGATIPNASITASNAATQVESTAQTDSSGEYSFDALPAGLYTVRFESPGFQRTVYDQVLILPPDSTELDVKLQVGTASESVMVEANSVMLITSSASVSMGGNGRGVAGGIAGVSGMRGPIRKDKREALAMAAPPPPNPGTPRLRQYFPETLLWYPEILTDVDGHATLRFPVADSITAWQLSIAASTRRGNVGGGVAGFRTTLPFFASLDPPQVLTVGDRIALPVALRNYLDHPVSVRSEWAAANWFRLDKSSGPVTVPAQGSATTTAELTATAATHAGLLRLTAKPTGEVGDAIERPVSVHPDGLEDAATVGGLVSEPTRFALTIPQDVLAGGAEARIKLYPNLGAHLRDALAGMAAYPDGCAEQILSIAWPSLLLQRYGASLPHADAKLAAETKRHLEEAYANLLANRDGNGGFRYWSNDSAPDLALTAYAIEFLTEASHSITVDEQVVIGAMRYLATQQDKSGLWIRVDRAGKPHPEDRGGNTMLTASIAAMIAQAPGAEPVIAKALAAVQPFVDALDEPYTLANYALAALAVKDTARSTAAIARLTGLARTENGSKYWVLQTNTPFFGWGRAGRVETTALVVQALVRSGLPASSDLVARGMMFLDHERDRQSLWYSTQATARALDALATVAFSGGRPGATAGGVLTVKVDGATVASTLLPPSDKDTGPIAVDLPQTLTAGPHTIELAGPARMSPATAQVVANFYRPWPGASAAVADNERLELKLSFDRQQVEAGDTVQATAHIERIGFRGYGMLVAEIGLPPGADVDRASLETAMTASGYVLNHYEVLPDRLLVYLWPQAGGYDLRFQFTPRYAMDALTAPSSVYDYYNPDARFDLKPLRFNVTERP